MYTLNLGQTDCAYMNILPFDQEVHLTIYMCSRITAGYKLFMERVYTNHVCVQKQLPFSARFYASFDMVHLTSLVCMTEL